MAVRMLPADAGSAWLCETVLKRQVRSLDAEIGLELSTGAALPAGMWLRWSFIERRFVSFRSADQGRPEQGRNRDERASVAPCGGARAHVLAIPFELAERTSERTRHRGSWAADDLVLVADGSEWRSSRREPGTHGGVSPGPVGALY